MPDLFGIADAYKNTDYITNRLTTPTDVSSYTPPTYSSLNNIAKDNAPEGWGLTAAKSLAAAPIDVIDTASSLFGTQRGSIDSKFWDGIGMPEMGRWVANNSGAVDSASGLLGSVAIGAGTDLAIGKVLGSAWFGATGLGKVVAPITEAVSKAKLAAADASIQAVKDGTTLSPWSAVAQKYFWTSTGTTLARAGTAELAIDGVMHNNEAVWSSDWGQNLFNAGIGLAIPVGLGSIAVRGQFLKWMNSDATRFERAAVADPGGYEKVLNTAPLGSMTGAGPAFTRDSAVITDLALNARRDDTVSVGGIPAPSSQATDNIGRNSIQNNLKAAVIPRMSIFSKKGIEGLGDTKFATTGASGEEGSAGNNIIQTVAKDPTALFGATSIGQVSKDTTAVKMSNAFNAMTDKLLSTKNLKTFNQGLTRKSRSLMFLIGNSWMTKDDAQAFTEYVPLDTKDFKSMSSGQISFNSNYSGRKFIIDENGGVSGNDYESLSVPDILHVRQGMLKMQDSMLAKNETLTVPKGATHFQLDHAIQFENAGGKVDWSVLGSNANAGDAQLASLIEKGKIAKPMPILDMRSRFKLNLPLPTSAERLSDPDGVVFKNWLMGANKNTDIQTMKDMRVQSQRIFDLTQDVKGNDSLDGNMFGFNKDGDKTSGAWLRPVMGTFQNQNPNYWTRFHLSEAIAEGKTARISELRGAPKADTTKAIVDATVQHPQFSIANDISGLHNSQLPGTDNVVGASTSQALTQAFRFRNTPAMLAAQDISRQAHRITTNALDAIYTKLKPVTDSLNAIGSAKSKVLFNQYWSHAAGWDISTTKAMGNGLTGFILDPTSTLNKTRLGRAPQPGEVMTNIQTGAPVVLDDASNQTRMSLEAVNTKLQQEKNAVRIARGQVPVKIKPFWTSPRDLTGKFSGFTLDATGKVVPGRAVVENTQADYDRAVQRIREENAKTNPSWKFRSQQEILKKNSGLDAMETEDAYSMSRPTGMNRAGTTSFEINPRSLEDALAYVKNGYEENTKAILGNIFDSQLLTATIRHNAATAVPGVKDIWQTYVETLLGTTYDAASKGVTGIFQAGDQFANKIIAAAWPAFAIPARGLNAYLGQLGYSQGKILGKTVNLTNVKSFSQLSSELANHMPFKDAMDYAQYVYKTPMPPEIKGITRAINHIGSSVILRWLELPQAVMNMTGIITNTPGLLNSRNAPIVGKIGNVGVIDSMKIMANGFKRMMLDRSSSDWDHMVEAGDVSQPFAAAHKHMALIKSQSTFSKVMLGDKSVKVDPSDPMTFLKHHGADGIAGYLTDTTESLAKTWAHFTGLELADHLGITGMTERHLFARGIANDTIANYDPLNKPEIYTSGIGSMYGMFLSYSQNYYQRMFHWIEDARYADVGKSLAMQASMFGYAGVPGFNQLAALHDALMPSKGVKQDQDSTFIDGLYQRYGVGLGNVLAHGGFDQLINILSAGTLPAVALHTRGDQNFRTPASDFLTTGGVTPIPPGLEVVKDLIQSTYGVLSSMLSGDKTVSPRYLAEIAARTMPNRLIHGALTVLAAGGNDTDVHGNVMAQTQSIAENVYRMLGVRSARQQASIDAYYANAQQQTAEASQRQALTERTRALVRTGAYDRLPAVFDEYVNTGGNPSNYPAWLREIVKTAGNTRTQNQLLKSMRSSTHQDLADRIQLYTGGQ